MEIKIDSIGSPYPAGTARADREEGMSSSGSDCGPRPGLAALAAERIVPEKFNENKVTLF